VSLNVLLVLLLAVLIGTGEIDFFSLTNAEVERLLLNADVCETLGWDGRIHFSLRFKERCVDSAQLASCYAPN
jgi:hypothetical protein